jgi:hypothetical protein
MGKLSVHEGESLDKLRKVVGNGCKNLTGTGNFTGLEAYCFIAQEDTTLTTFKVNGVDSISAYGLGVSIKAGAYIVVPEGSQITDITMSAGSVIIYNL